jgi:hypothetical protein
VKPFTLAPDHRRYLPASKSTWSEAFAMNNSHDEVDTTATIDATLAEHRRTHRRWARTVLALYAVLVAVGLLVTLAHQSIIASSGGPEMQVASRKAVR